METKNISKASFASQVLVYLSYKHLGDWQKIMADVCQHKIDVDPKDMADFSKDFINKDLNFVTMVDEAYPHQLKSRYQPPLVLYYRGNLELLNDSTYENRVSILGTSKPTDRALKQAEQHAFNCAKDNKILVVDLAKGISTQAIKTFLANNQRIIVLLPSGLNNIYPSDNQGLIDEILKNPENLVITEFPDIAGASINTLARKNVLLGQLAKTYSFIQVKRNKGSLAIVAASALQNNAYIEAVPDSNDSESLCNDLIIDGAYPLFDLAYIQ